MARVVFMFAIIIFSMVAHAEIVTCKTTNKSKIKNVRLVRVEHNYEPQWLEGEVKIGLFEKERVVVEDAPRGQSLNYIDYEYKGQFWLELGPYKGAGVYSNAKLSYKKSYADPDKVTAEMKCVLSGAMRFKDYCERTSGNSPESNLLSSARNHNIGVLLSTLACGIDVSIKDERGCTPVLITADSDCGTGKFDIYRPGGAYADKIISALLDKGAMAEDLDPVTMETPLHKLVRRQNLRAVSPLIDFEVDINVQDKEGFTPLMRAVETGSSLVVDAMVSAGADLLLKNNSGQTAMDIAVSKKFTYLLPYLVEAKTLEVVGTDDGKCAPMEFQVEAGKAVKITLKNDSSKMFMLTSKKLELSLMVNGNSSQSQRFQKLEPGNYPISCGVMAGQQYLGKITVVNE